MVNNMNEIKLQYTFMVDDVNHGVVTEVFAEGFHYHTYDKMGNVVRGQQYMLKTNLSDISHLA